jgi:hypothetical protein
MAQQLNESLLELAEGDANVSAQDVVQLGGARGVGPLGEHGLDLSWGGAVFDPCLVTGSCQGIEGEVCCDVYEGACDAGDGDLAPGRRVREVEAARSSRPDAGHAALGARGHLRRWRRSLEEPEEMRGGAAAEQRALAAGQDGRQVARLDARRAVADAINPAMHRQQRARANATLELSDRHPGIEELATGDHPMLPRRQTREFRLRCPAFGSHHDP